MKNYFKFYICITFFIIGYLIGVFEKNLTTYNNKHTDIDTTYNTIELDSITYRIIIKDSIIYHLKIQSNEAIEKSYSISDSDAVVLFKQLTSE